MDMIDAFCPWCVLGVCEICLDWCNVFMLVLQYLGVVLSGHGDGIGKLYYARGKTES